MALRGNGRLLVFVKAQPLRTVFSAAPPFILPGYQYEPLSPALQARTAVSDAAPSDHWLLARPNVPGPLTMSLTSQLDLPPWDAAHAVAQANGYKHYVEPDIVFERPAPPLGVLGAGLDSNWPPRVTNNAGVSPGWHLAFAGFDTVRGLARGAGVRIAHLDTGYTPGHASKPRCLREDLAYDFWENKPQAVDPGMPGLVMNPGHGTATLAVLAGNSMDLQFGGCSYNGDFGGAPDAEVVPVRISPSVIHICTSSMAQGLYYALAPRDEAANRCDVVTISHGGLPARAWAAAVNALYDDGIVIVAASGDNKYEGVDLATHFTVYPSAYNRVLTAVGVTYDKTPYITTTLNELQGCWGPDIVMDKAVAAYTPNIAWMKYDACPAGFDMNGAGTSASTPQIAGACALWLQLYRDKFVADWHRVEACRVAMFESADPNGLARAKVGWGLLRVPELLRNRTDDLIDREKSGAIKPEPQDDVSWFAAFWRVVLGYGPPESEADRMYETEVSQVVAESGDANLVQAAWDASDPNRLRTFSQVDRDKYRARLLAASISQALKQRIGKG